MALVTTLMTMMLLAMLGSALAMLAGMEARISGGYRAGLEALYAADAAVEVAVEELRNLPDWVAVLEGRVTSELVFGDASGIHQTAAGPLDLTEATGLSGWRLYARGDLRHVLRLEGADAASYVIVWVAAVPTGEPDRLAIRAAAYGTAGVQRTVEVRVIRDGPPPGVRRLSWHEVR
jgi:hypothetical protein